MSVIGYKTLWGKGENAGYQHFLLFSQFYQNLLRVVKSQDYVVKTETLDQKIPNFNHPEEELFLKTLWKKEKMLVTSIFSISHNEFYPFKYTYLII